MLFIVCHFVNVGALESKFHSFRSSYGRNKLLINKWNKLPSGSAGRPTKKPKVHKYTAELSIIDEVTVSEKTNNNFFVYNGLHTAAWGSLWNSATWGIPLVTSRDKLNIDHAHSHRTQRSKNFLEHVPGYALGHVPGQIPSVKVP